MLTFLRLSPPCCQAHSPSCFQAHCAFVLSSSVVRASWVLQVFGPKKTRKKPKLSVPDLDAMVATAAEKVEKYVPDDDGAVEREAELRDLVGDKVFEKGTSKRIWGELYKVLDCSDVVIQVCVHVWGVRSGCGGGGGGGGFGLWAMRTPEICVAALWTMPWRAPGATDLGSCRQLGSERVACAGTCSWGCLVQVLDARDPLGTRSPRVEAHLKENAKHKHLIFVLNKCDLVPTWVTKKYVCLQVRLPVCSSPPPPPHTQPLACTPLPLVRARA